MDVLLGERRFRGRRDALGDDRVSTVADAELDDGVPVLPGEEVFVHNLDHIVHRALA